MNKKVPLGATFALIIIAVALTISVTMVIAMRQFNSKVSDVGKRQVMFEYITDIDKAVRQHYAGTIDEEKLREALTRGYIDGVGDPYAAYYTASEYRIQVDRMAGKRTGLGLRVSVTSDNRLKIAEVEKNSAAERAGVLKGDEITALDGTPVSTSDCAAVADRLERAEKIIVTVLRGEQSTAFELSPSPYTVNSVEGRLIDTTGYIRITEFNDLTLDQFKSVYASLEEQGAQQYIFDLRNNSGGRLAAARSVIEYLMPRGVYAHQTDSAGVVTDLTDGDGYQMDKSSVTLVNQHTAGEAELFAGVLQEFSKTAVVGVQTAGRGMVQDYYGISSDGSAVRLSVAHLSLITGGGFEGTGITPNVMVGMTAGQEQDFAFLEDAQDPQLQAALAAVRQPMPTAPTTAPTAAPEEG
ncbi:MAG: PDZ domain-containing protein [Clostridiales bacterium]|nr:PDZ domain-containing protein [Clostridiales bacterium]